MVETSCERVLCLSATDVVIIYLSSGVTSRESSEQEKRATLSVVREENRHLNNSAMILTYALMNGTSPRPPIPPTTAFAVPPSAPVWTRLGLFSFLILSKS